MFVIKNTVTGRIHREPNKKPWASTEYKSQAAAKAGITRTLKYYQKALDNVAECKSRGEKPYTAPLYNAYRDVTEPALGRQYVNDPDTYQILTSEAYWNTVEMVTRTGTSPYSGKEITVTLNVNDVGTHMDPLCESHYTR